MPAAVDMHVIGVARLSRVWSRIGVRMIVIVMIVMMITIMGGGLFNACASGWVLAIGGSIGCWADERTSEQDGHHGDRDGTTDSRFS